MLSAELAPRCGKILTAIEFAWKTTLLEYRISPMAKASRQAEVRARSRNRQIFGNYFVRPGEDYLKLDAPQRIRTESSMPDNLAKLSDSELLRLSVGGDEKAFLGLYERLKAPIFRYAFYMTNSQSAAEEVTQEVFLALLKIGGRYQKARGDVQAFAFGIARNLVRRVRRRERVYEELPRPEAWEKLPGAQTGSESVPGELIRTERLENIRSAIASLPDHYRQVVVICDLCELSYAEAASRLGCAVGTVRSRLNRAHQVLARKLKRSQGPESALSTSGTEECLI
jgi:RNA polymerase sigma-70 factor (ECF subfamily)